MSEGQARIYMPGFFFDDSTLRRKLLKCEDGVFRTFWDQFGDIIQEVRVVDGLPLVDTPNPEIVDVWHVDFKNPSLLNMMPKSHIKGGLAEKLSSYIVQQRTHPSHAGIVTASFLRPETTIDELTEAFKDVPCNVDISTGQFLSPDLIGYHRLDGTIVIANSGSEMLDSLIGAINKMAKEDHHISYPFVTRGKMIRRNLNSTYLMSYSAEEGSQPRFILRVFDPDSERRVMDIYGVEPNRRVICFARPEQGYDLDEIYTDPTRIEVKLDTSCFEKLWGLYATYLSTANTLRDSSPKNKATILANMKCIAAQIGSVLDGLLKPAYKVLDEKGVKHDHPQRHQDGIEIMIQ